MTEQDIGWLIQMDSRLLILKTFASGKVQLGPKAVVVFTSNIKRRQHVSVINPSLLPGHAYTRRM